MTEYTGIDVSKLPAPDAVETLDFEEILSRLVASYSALFPEFTAFVESDPGYKLLIVCAYEVMRMRARINDAVKQNMLAYATGSNLDHIAANLLVTRKVLVPADPDTNTPAVMESDAELRRRAQLSPEGYTTAGSAGSYVFHALSAHPDIIDAAVYSPNPKEVVVTIMSRVGNGEPSQAAYDAVDAKLSGDTVRPLTDQVIVTTVQVVDYQVAATLYTLEGPDASLVIAEATARLTAMVSDLRRIGRDIPLSAIYAALHVEGVQRVVITSPASDVLINGEQAGHCTGITIVHGGVGA